MMTLQGRRQERGFTIVELMIASLVFSVILLVVTFGVLSFTNAYYKGVHTAATQTAARTLIDTITQSLQFNGGKISAASNPAGTITTYCIGNKQYDFEVGTLLSGGNHILYETPLAANATCAPHAFDSTSRELLSDKMRLAAFSVTPSSGTEGLFTVHVRVAYGENDLFASKTGTVPPTGQIPADIAAGLYCKPDTGGNQFCSVVDLESTVEKRVQ